MAANGTSVKSYGSVRAIGYDQDSLVNKGDREMQRNTLADVLKFLHHPPSTPHNPSTPHDPSTFHDTSTPHNPSTFLDLGCGTGFFSAVFYDLFPHIKGTLLDGSPDMLEMAKRRFHGKPVSVNYKVRLFQEIGDEDFPRPCDLVFSSLAIHHLEDDHKWRLFRQIYENMAPGGIFILYDLFRLEDERSNAILEYLACRDIQRRIMADLETDVILDELAMDRIIENDRHLRREEGDKEAKLQSIVDKLRQVGFRSVTTFLQEARFAGTICFKI